MQDNIVPADVIAAAPDTSSPDDVRLRKVLTATMRGETQEEIARRFRVTSRTVRRWITEAKLRRIAIFQGVTPEEILARTDHMHAILTATLLKRLERAERRGDDRAIESLSRELRGIQRDAITIRTTAGFFNGWRFDNLDRLEDPRVRAMRVMQEAMREVFSPPVLELEPTHHGDGGDAV